MTLEEVTEVLEALRLGAYYACMEMAYDCWGTYDQKTYEDLAKSYKEGKLDGDFLNPKHPSLRSAPTPQHS